MDEYLIEKRITKAKEMLRFTDMTMDEIAEAIGVNEEMSGIQKPKIVQVSVSEDSALK